MYDSHPWHPGISVAAPIPIRNPLVGVDSVFETIGIIDGSLGFAVSVRTKLRPSLQLKDPPVAILFDSLGQHDHDTRLGTPLKIWTFPFGRF